MSLKLICLLAIIALCAIMIVTEARDDRNRGNTFAKQAVDEKFARHRLRLRHSHHKSTSSHSSSRSHKSHDTDHNSNSSPGFWARLFNTQSSSTSHKNQRHDTAHENHNSHTTSDIVARDQRIQSSSNRRKSQRQDTDNNGHTISDIVARDQRTQSSSNRRKSQKQDTDNVKHNSHTTFNEQSQHNSHNWYPLGSSTQYYGTLTANPHVSNNWGGHQLPPGHVYVTQPSSIPANAVYYAQPPTHTSTDDSTAFDLGYLVGRSLTRNHHYHHHHYEQQPQTQASNEKQTKVVIVENQMNATGVVPTTNQTNYWPTDSETPLAPLNNTLIPNGVSQATEPIFKNPAIASAQNLTPENFELPTATAAPPETPPANGIICMPWSFNETDPSNPENVIVVEKTICFPAPPAPPASPTNPLMPNTGDIGLDVSTTPTATTT